MTNNQFIEKIKQKLKNSFKDAKFNIRLITQEDYIEKFSQKFRIPSSIDFSEPIAIIRIVRKEETEFWLAYIDQKGIGYICEEDFDEKKKRIVIQELSFFKLDVLTNLF